MTDIQLANTRCAWTNDTSDEATLRELFSMEPEDDALADIVRTHSGEWRYDGNGVWRYWKLPDEDDLSIVEIVAR